MKNPIPLAGVVLGAAILASILLHHRQPLPGAKAATPRAATTASATRPPDTRSSGHGAESPAISPRVAAIPPASPARESRPGATAGTADPDLENLGRELAHAENTFFDPTYRFTGKIPAGWVLRDAPRWGEQETTLYFKDPEYPAAIPNLYYRKFPEPMTLEGAAIDQWLREQVETKAAQRAASGRPDYANREVTPRRIGERPAITWVADFTYQGEAWSEYLTRIYTQDGTTLFFMSAPKKDTPALVPRFESLIQNTIMP